MEPHKAPTPRPLVPVFNATWCGNDWKSLDVSGLYANVQVLQALFVTELARRMEALDQPVAWQRATWELAETPRAIIDLFINRTLDIKATAADRKIRDPAELGLLGGWIRRPKDRDISLEHLVHAWRLRRADFAADYPHVVHVIPAPSADKISPREALLRGRQHLETFSWSWTRDALLSEALYAGRGHVELASLERELQVLEKEQTGSPDQLLVRELGRKIIYTTPAVLSSAGLSIDVARATKGQFCPIPFANQNPTITSLSKEHRQVVATVLSSCDMVSILDVKAGPERTALLKVISNAAADDNHDILAVGGTAESVSFLQEQNYEPLSAKDFVGQETKPLARGRRLLIVVDEAGLVSAPLLGQLLCRTREIKARVLLVGDAYSGAARNRGDSLHLLARRAELTLASTRRPFPSAASRSRVLAVVNGAPPETAEALALPPNSVRPEQENKDAEPSAPAPGRTAIRRGLLSVLPDVSERLQAILEKAEELAGSKAPFFVVSDRRHAAELTDAMRLRFFGPAYLEPTAMRQFDMLAESAMSGAVPFALQSGDVIRLRGDTPLGKCGEEFTVVSADTGVTVVDQSGVIRSAPLAADQIRHFRPTRVALGVGDWLQFTDSLVTEDSLFAEGEVVKVDAFTDAGEIQLSDCRVVPADFCHLRRGWVVTPDVLPPSKVRRAIVADLDPSPASSLKELCAWAASCASRLTVFSGSEHAAELGFFTQRQIALDAFLPALVREVPAAAPSPKPPGLPGVNPTPPAVVDTTAPIAATQRPGQLVLTAGGAVNAPELPAALKQPESKLAVKTGDKSNDESAGLKVPVMPSLTLVATESPPGPAEPPLTAGDSAAETAPQVNTAAGEVTKVVAGPPVEEYSLDDFAAEFAQLNTTINPAVPASDSNTGPGEPTVERPREVGTVLEKHADPRRLTPSGSDSKAGEEPALDIEVHSGDTRDLAARKAAAEKQHQQIMWQFIIAEKAVGYIRCGDGHRDGPYEGFWRKQKRWQGATTEELINMVKEWGEDPRQKVECIGLEGKSWKIFLSELSQQLVEENAHKQAREHPPTRAQTRKPIATAVPIAPTPVPAVPAPSPAESPRQSRFYARTPSHRIDPYYFDELTDPKIAREITPETMVSYEFDGPFVAASTFPDLDGHFQKTPRAQPAAAAPANRDARASDIAQILVFADAGVAPSVLIPPPEPHAETKRAPSGATKDDDFHTAVGIHPDEPYTLGEMLEMIATKKVRPLTRIRKGAGEEIWAEDFKEFQDAFAKVRAQTQSLPGAGPPIT